MKKNNTPFSLGYRFLATIKHRYALQGFIAFLFLSLYNPLSMEAQAPNISYSGVAANYPLNAAIPTLTPNNSGGAVVGTLGAVITLAGSGSFAFADGTGTAASFNNPYGVAVDASGNVYVADTDNHRIRKITAAGVVTTLAGSGTGAFADGTGTAASFSNPYGVATDASGNVYVADQTNHRIRKITAAGVVTTLAGSGTPAFANGTGTAASFRYPTGVATDASGNVYVADNINSRIRKITSVGYSISPALPTGLSMNTSGVISGTPTVVTASKAYTITGVNLAGSSTTTITFGVGTTAVKDVSEQLNTLTIKPTLAQDVVLIVLSDNKATTVRVFNIAGQQVLTTKAQGEQQMTISTLPSGLYIIRTETGKVGRFVKQ